MWIPYSLGAALKYEKASTFSMSVIDAEGYAHFLQPNDFVVFTAKSVSVPTAARVNRFDLTSEYPIELEWYDLVNNKRLSRFKPEDFTDIVKEETLYDAIQTARRTIRADV